jgi:alkylhydroperoxidase family enzyme
MLSLEDCIAFSGLTPDQLEAVACFKHVPVIVAAEWAETALTSRDGTHEVETALAEEAKLAASHHLGCAECWNKALSEFRKQHPELA